MSAKPLRRCGRHTMVLHTSCASALSFFGLIGSTTCDPETAFHCLAEESAFSKLRTPEVGERTFYLDHTPNLPNLNHLADKLGTD